MPAEWEPHEATWIAWPHNRSDWPGKFETVPWIYAEIVRHLARVEQERHGIRVAGTYCPPFRPLTEKEESEIQRIVEAAAPDVLWVGLSTPKQEQWMYAHRDTLRVPVMLGVGAAFDLNTGRLSQAPGWMRENGLEWLYRLCAEPRRLWSRYIVNGSKFVWAVCREHFAPRIFRQEKLG